MSRTTERAIALMQARFTIEDLMTVYAERVDAGDIAQNALDPGPGGVDAGDMEGVGELFARGSVTMPGGAELVGAQAVRDGYVGSVVFYDANGERADYVRRETTPRTRHFITNKAFDFNEDVTAAECRSAFFVMQQIGERYEPIVGGRYLDRFELGAAGWRFAHREVVIDAVGDSSHHAAAEGG